MDNKIDHRRNYVIVLDTETANTQVNLDGKLCMDYVLPYDIGWAVVDTRGNVYEKHSYCVEEIFLHERELMISAYYATKIPKYYVDLVEGRRTMKSTYQVKKLFGECMEKYNTKIVCAHNMRFDYRACNNLQRWVTKSKYRYFFPYGTTFWDTMKMAQSVMFNMPTYQHFCADNGYTTPTGRLQCTAEVLYKFISRNNDFEEVHMGIEDVEIEAQILAYCYRQHKAMKKEAWGR